MLVIVYKVTKLCFLYLNVLSQRYRLQVHLIQFVSMAVFLPLALISSIGIYIQVLWFYYLFAEKECTKAYGIVQTINFYILTFCI